MLPSNHRVRLLGLMLLAVFHTTQAFVLPSSGRPTTTTIRPATAVDQQNIAAGEAQRLATDLVKIQETLNTKHVDLLAKFIKAYTPLGETISKANFWRGDAMTIQNVRVTKVGLDALDLHVTLSEAGMFGGVKTLEQDETITFSKNKQRTTAANVQRALISMASAMGDDEATASLYKVKVDDSKWVLPNNLYLNNVPNSRFARSFFYRKLTRAIDEAIVDPSFPNRMQVKLLTPEANPAFDTYRIGTILEAVREIAFHQVSCGKRIKLCVQQKMGEGVFKGLPISLNGCRIILENMDWATEEGEDYAGAVGTKIVFGEVGPHVVEEEDDVFLLIAPQNVVGVSIIPLLEEMAKKAGNRPFIVLNPRLYDVPSANNVMQIKGREERVAFAKSFTTAFHFETLHDKGLFKIVGAVGKAGHDQPWVQYRLLDNQEGLENVNDRWEVYEPVQVTERPPG